ncbi:MAG: tetratricopeptide repeat protein [Saprospiraceae bacterium]|nr:tetratricopeptide repeat protein [Saprospiraceae bacterium]
MLTIRLSSRSAAFLALAWLLLITLPSCMPSVSTTVLQPARFKLPEHIAKVAVVDRSKPSNGWLNVLEGAFTGESIGQDRTSRQKAVEGLSDVLQRTPRFKVINTGIEMSGSKAGVNLPTPLEWAEVERICADFQADALVTIESFDTDNNVSTRRELEKRKDKNGKQYTVTRYYSRMNTNVRTGWRMYDPKTRSIIDETITDDEASDSGSGDTERQAVSSLPSPVSVSRKIAYVCGQEYGMRIAPTYVQVHRPYYKKAKGYSDQMRQAARYVESHDWDRAIPEWESIENLGKGNGDRKAAGRAAYNLAVAAEMQGDLDRALEWAKISWEQYGNKKGRGYIQTLLQRQSDDARAADQMNKKV